MQSVRKYVDEMFRELPNSKRAKDLKAEIISNMEERYLELSENNSDVNQVEKQLINEIGTSEEIRENINLNNTKKQIIGIVIELSIIVLAFGSSIYVKNNDWKLVQQYSVIPRYIVGVISNPIAVFFAIVLILTLLNYIIRPHTIFIQDKTMRFSLLIVSIFLFALYVLMLLRFLGIIIPFIPWKLFYFFTKNITIIAGVTGIFYYLGIKK